MKPILPVHWKREPQYGCFTGTIAAYISRPLDALGREIVIGDDGCFEAIEFEAREPDVRV